MATDPYKKKEFEAFIKTISEGQVAHWLEIAGALGIDKNTVTAWKNLPEAQDAIQRGIDHALQCMEQAGGRDWKMWESKLKMLGVNPANKTELQLTSPARGVLRAAGLLEGEGGREVTEDTTRPSDSSA